MPGFAGATQIGYAQPVLCAVMGQKISCAIWDSSNNMLSISGPPAALVGAASIAQMAVTYEGVCGLTTGGRVVCWGDSAPMTAPETDIGLSGVTQIRAIGDGGVCGLINDGTVKCWSLMDETRYNYDGSMIVLKKYQPAIMSGMTSIATLYASDSTANPISTDICGFRLNGSVICKSGAFNSDTRPETALFTGVQNLFFDAEFMCARGVAGTSCFGRKPYRLVTDLLGQLLHF